MNNQAFEKQKQSLLKSTKTVDNIGGVLWLATQTPNILC